MGGIVTSKVINGITLSNYAGYMVISCGNDQMIILYYFDHHDYRLVLASSASRVDGVDEIYDD